MIKRLWNKLDSTTKAAVAVIGLYFFLYAWIGAVEAVGEVVLRAIFL